MLETPGLAFGLMGHKEERGQFLKVKSNTQGEPLAAVHLLKVIMVREQRQYRNVNQITFS